MSNEYKDWFHDKVFEYAFDKHKDQVRKYTNEPYINHPINVAKWMGLMAEKLTLGVKYISLDTIYKLQEVAYLHDTVEDTDATFEEIEKEFGPYFKEMVYWLTNVSKPEDGNRKVRKQIDAEHICQAPLDAIIVKLADIYDNCKDIVDNDPAFAKKYLEEKHTLLKMLSEKRPLILGKEWDEKEWLYVVCYQCCYELIEMNLERLRNV